MATVEKTAFLMDTVVTIKLFVEVQESRTAAAFLDSALERMVRLEALADTYQPQSEISRVNRTAARTRVHLSPALAALLKKAGRIDSLSRGSFTPALGALTALWGFGRRDTMTVPSAGEIREALQHVGQPTYRLSGDSLAFEDAAAAFDLGGIAKGYAVDAAIEYLRAQGFTDVQVDAGGDLRAMASARTAGMRNVYVRHPLKSDGFYGRFPLNNGAVATSGDYERFFVAQGVRYHHLLDPHTGYPARACRSATILGEEAAACDALATAVFVLGPEKGMALVERLPGIEGLIVFEENDTLIYKISTGLAPVFEWLEQ